MSTLHQRFRLYLQSFPFFFFGANLICVFLWSAMILLFWEFEWCSELAFEWNIFNLKAFVTHAFVIT